MLGLGHISGQRRLEQLPARGYRFWSILKFLQSGPYRVPTSSIGSESHLGPYKPAVIGVYFRPEAVTAGATAGISFLEHFEVPSERPPPGTSPLAPPPDAQPRASREGIIAIELHIIYLKTPLR